MLDLTRRGIDIAKAGARRGERRLGETNVGKARDLLRRGGEDLRGDVAEIPELRGVDRHDPLLAEAAQRLAVLLGESAALPNTRSPCTAEARCPAELREQSRTRQSPRSMRLDAAADHRLAGGPLLAVSPASCDSGALRSADRPQSDRKTPAAVNLRSPRPSNTGEHKRTAGPQSPVFFGVFARVRWLSRDMRQSGRPDLNRGPHRPERCALPGCATPR